MRYGFPRIQILLQREGWRDNHKRTYRIYREEGLNLRSKRPRRSKMAAHRQGRPVLTGPHQCWSMDFVSDQLFDGRRFRALTLVDNYSRECLEIEVGQSLKGFDVVDVMERIKQVRGVVPKRIQVDRLRLLRFNRRPIRLGHKRDELIFLGRASLELDRDEAARQIDVAAIRFAYCPIVGTPDKFVLERAI